tara:strand:+ start:658 stop:906 length:249 start_codon:yes stop_codon:yes gene_type:complete
MYQVVFQEHQIVESMQVVEDLERQNICHQVEHLEEQVVEEQEDLFRLEQEQQEQTTLVAVEVEALEDVAVAQVVQVEQVAQE